MKDSYGRKINYLRLSVTDRCNFRCKYCLPEEGVEKRSKHDLLSFEKITNLVKAATSLGVRKVRLTGGEPLSRKDLPRLVEMLSSIDGVQDLSLTTNGSMLADFAEDLSRAGLDRVNVSLDTLKPDNFKKITRREGLDSVLAGIKAAKVQLPGPVKLNTVILKGVNESEVLPLVDYAVKNDLILRFIELMPIGQASAARYEPLPLSEIKEKLNSITQLGESKSTRGNGPASYYRIKRDGNLGTIGFIFPVSKKFCLSCNRVRVTATGNVRPCLAQDEDYKLKIDPDSPNKLLKKQLKQAIKNKPAGHLWGDQECTPGKMSEIGG